MEILKLHTPRFVDQQVWLQLVANLIGLHFSLDVALPELENHIVYLVLVLFLVVLDLLQKQKVDHEASRTTAQ